MTEKKSLPNKAQIAKLVKAVRKSLKDKSFYSEKESNAVDKKYKILSVYGQLLFTNLDTVMNYSDLRDSDSEVDSLDYELYLKAVEKFIREALV